MFLIDIQPGQTFKHTFVVSNKKTVPSIYPESKIFQNMPDVFATGFLVAFLEWTCVELIHPYLDNDKFVSLGTKVNFSHLLPTPVGLTVKSTSLLTEKKNNRLKFFCYAYDKEGKISEGAHERVIVEREWFEKKIQKKSN